MVHVSNERVRATTMISSHHHFLVGGKTFWHVTMSKFKHSSLASIYKKQARRLGADGMPSADARLSQWQKKREWKSELFAGWPPPQRHLAPAFQVLTVFIKQSSTASQLEGRGMSEGKKKKSRRGDEREKDQVWIKEISLSVWLKSSDSQRQRIWEGNGWKTTKWLWTK